MFLPLSSPPDSAPPSMRVAHLVRPAEGGMRVQVRSLLAASPSGLLAAPTDVCDFCADLVASGDSLMLAAVRRPDKLLLSGARAGKWVKGRGAQILHGHGLSWLPLFAAAQIASGLPLVVTLHNLVPDDLSGAQTLVLRAALRQAARVICVSEAVAESAKKIASADDKITVVRNGIDTARFDNPVPARADVRAGLNLPPDALVVLCVARLSPEKGIPTLLQAAVLLRPKSPGMRLFLAGDGPQKNEWEHMAQRRGLHETVTFLGTRTDIPTLLRAADLYVQPSLSEGLGLAVLEAMASGLAVVATRTGGLPEVVVPDRTGMLVPPGDAVALADAIHTLLSDTARRNAMGRAGRERAARHFGISRMVSETRSVYETILLPRRAEGRA